jgi:hypothetical protein
MCTAAQISDGVRAYTIPTTLKTALSAYDVFDSKTSLFAYSINNMRKKNGF